MPIAAGMMCRRWLRADRGGGERCVGRARYVRAGAERRRPRRCPTDARGRRQVLSRARLSASRRHRPPRRPARSERASVNTGYVSLRSIPIHLGKLRYGP